MHHLRFLCLLVAVTCLSVESFAWCKKPVQLTHITINDMSTVWQLTFLHQVPKNKLDEYVKELTETNLKHLTNHEALIDAIGALKTNDALCFLYFCGMGRSMIDDVTPFDAQCGIVQPYGYKTLNKYFLNGRVDEKLPTQKFNAEVMRLCAQKMPLCYYCPELPQELTLEQMKKVSTKKYDDAIIAIIKSNNDLGSSDDKQSAAASLGSRIQQQAMQLDFVEDCFWDHCGPKIDIYPEPFNFSVIMIIDGKRVERCYRVHGATVKRGLIPGKVIYDNDHLDYKSAMFCPGAVAEARASCGK